MTTTTFGLSAATENGARASRASKDRIMACLVSFARSVATGTPGTAGVPPALGISPGEDRPRPTNVRRTPHTQTRGRRHIEDHSTAGKSKRTSEKNERTQSATAEETGTSSSHGVSTVTASAI